MPSGIFPVPKFRPVPDRARPTLADPAKNSELNLRAGQLRSRAERSRVANALEEALGDASGAERVTIKSRASQRRKWLLRKP